MTVQHPGLPPPKPIPLKERSSIVFVEKGNVDVLDGAFVVVDMTGIRTQIPIGSLACLMLEPGTRVSHAAVHLAASAGCLLIWVGEAGVRVYSAGQPGGARSDRLLYQARLALDEATRLGVVRRMFALRFGEEAPERRSVDQLRGIEGTRVRETYKVLADQCGVRWQSRSYDPHNWGTADLPNRCMSAATSCLHGLTEAAILAAGYAPAIGFLHVGRPLSFVYDIADLYKFSTVVPIAFRITAAAMNGNGKGPPERQVRLACRDSFRRSGLLMRLIPDIDDVLSYGGVDVPPLPEAAQWPVLPDVGHTGDVGHRS